MKRADYEENATMMVTNFITPAGERTASEDAETDKVRKRVVKFAMARFDTGDLMNSFDMNLICLYEHFLEGHVV